LSETAVPSFGRRRFGGGTMQQAVNEGGRHDERTHRMKYTAFALVPSDTDTSLRQAETYIREFYAQQSHAASGTIQIVSQDETLTIHLDSWRMFVVYNCEPYVLEESKDIAEMLSRRHPEMMKLQGYGCRFELWSDEDPNMDYFNEYLFVLEQLSKIPEAVLVDHQSGTLIE
jgi:hypothetical protein